VREFARLNPSTTTLATAPGVIAIKQISSGFEEKAEAFRKGGNEIYS
jgi:phosphomethylpyrimidine synthase